MRAWFREMVVDCRMTRNEIAAWLSDRFVSVAPMTVYRFAGDVPAFDGYGRGTRLDRKPRGGRARVTGRKAVWWT